MDGKISTNKFASIAIQIKYLVHIYNTLINTQYIVLTVSKMRNEGIELYAEHILTD